MTTTDRIRCSSRLALAGCLLALPARTQEEQEPKAATLQLAVALPPGAFAGTDDVARLRLLDALVAGPQGWADDRGTTSHPELYRVAGVGESLLLTVGCPPADAASPQYAAALAKALQERLDTLLLAPRRERLRREVEVLGATHAERSRQADAAAAELLALGADDLGGVHRALADLTNRRLDLQLDLRTEESVQRDLQRRLAEADAAVADARKAMRSVETAIQQTELLQAEQQAGGKAPDQSLAAMLAQRLDEARTTRADYDRALAALHTVQDQTTSSALQLQRWRDRDRVLDELLVEQTSAAATAAERARARQQAERRCAEARADAERVRQQLVDTRLQLELLTPITVTPWQ